MSARVLVPVLPFAGPVAPMAGVATELEEDLPAPHHSQARGGPLQGGLTALGADREPWRQAPDLDDADLAATSPQVGSGKGVRAGRADGEHVVLRSGVGRTRDLVALHARLDLRTGRPRPARTRAAVDRVLGDPAFRGTARRRGAGLTAAGVAPRAADLVEEVLLSR